MNKYSNEIFIPESIIRILNRHQIELNLNDIERCEEDMYSESVAIPFSLLFDLDLACIKLVQSLYNKVPFWNDNINKSDNELRKLLINRKNENPLTIIHNPDMNLDSLYKSLIEQNYGKILGIAMTLPTALFDLIKLMNVDETTSINIYCDAFPNIDRVLWDKISNLEKKALSEKHAKENFSFITDKLRGCESYKKYTVIFYKYSSELDRDYITMSSSDYAWGGKSILCANYAFNLDEKIITSLRMDIVLKTGVTNNIGLTSVYRDTELQ